MASKGEGEGGGERREREGGRAREREREGGEKRGGDREGERVPIYLGTPRKMVGRTSFIVLSSDPLKASG